MATTQEFGSAGSSSRLGEVGSSVRDTVTDEARHAREAVSDVTSDLSERASALAGEAAEAAKAKAEDAKDGLSSMLDAFGGALRAASDHLSNEQPAASKMVAEAATGLEKLSGSLGSKPLGAVLEDMRAMGRDNAGGLFAGSVLAGVALGRFFRAGETGQGQNGNVGTGGGQSSPASMGQSAGTAAGRSYDRGPSEERDEPASSSLGGSGTGAAL